MELINAGAWLGIGILCFVLSYLFGNNIIKVSDPEIENFHILLSTASFLVGVASLIVSATYAIKALLP